MSNMIAKVGAVSLFSPTEMRVEVIATAEVDISAVNSVVSTEVIVPFSASAAITNAAVLNKAEQVLFEVFGITREGSDVIKLFGGAS